LVLVERGAQKETMVSKVTSVQLVILVQLVVMVLLAPPVKREMLDLLDHPDLEAEMVLLV